MKEIEFKRKPPVAKRIHIGELSAEQKAGMRIAQILLWMIGGVIVLYATICLEHGCGQSRAPALPNAATIEISGQNSPEQFIKLDKQLDFAFSNLKFVLNILLPVFTTVLGYIFGSRFHR